MELARKSRLAPPVYGNGDRQELMQDMHRHMLGLEVISLPLVHWLGRAQGERLGLAICCCLLNAYLSSYLLRQVDRNCES